MDITIYPGKLAGSISAIPSKSQAHRLLICAAFADSPTFLICPETNRDMDATADCLNALGANIQKTAEGYTIIPVQRIPDTAELHCHDSGSTLRFLLPVAGALGVKATFVMEGRLPYRPMSPLWEEMERTGCRLSRPTENTILCEGKLQPGEFSIAGGVSSQFITGLLFACGIMEGKSKICVTGNLESRPYVDMTLDAMSVYGIPCAEEKQTFVLSGNQFHSPGNLTVEGDWSNGAFFLAAKKLGSNLLVSNLNSNSIQGDRAAAYLLDALSSHQVISAKDIPDLVPVLSVAAAVNQGAVFTDIARLRLKESDRVASVIDMLTALGGKAEADDNTLTIYATGLTGGTVNAQNDHRIAMSAAIAATACSKPVTIIGAQCTEKSYPQFWTEYARLGGNYEQHIR